MTGTGADVFDSQLAAWRSWQHAPWGRIRYAVVAESLRRTCVRLGDGPLRIVDVGGGDGVDALPLAEAGHDVTVVDQSGRLLSIARARSVARGLQDRLKTVPGDAADIASLDLGQFDLVLCHNVLQYVADAPATLDALAGLVRTRGALSIMAINPASDVLTAAIRREDLDEAERMLTAGTSHAHVFDHEVQRLYLEDVLNTISGYGFTDAIRYGVRAVVDYLPDDARKSETEFFDKLLRLELQLFDREPFLRTARLWQLVAFRK